MQGSPLSLLNPTELSDAELAALEYVWEAWARPEQRLPRGDWQTWLVLAGRGFGKTRTGAEAIIEVARKNAKWRLALIAPTAGDVRDVMVEGESGILARSPPWFRPEYEPSKRRLTWPNGTIATTFSAEEPERLRGPQHHFAWADELAAWRYVDDAWDQLMFGLRLGRDPRAIATTTPKPIKLVRELLASPTTRSTRGKTYDNAANLAGTFLSKIIAKYRGTRLGRQELDGEVLDDNPGALWRRLLIDLTRRRRLDDAGKLLPLPDFRRKVVAVDPAVTSNPDSNETGIIVGGIEGYGEAARAYVLEDLSGIYKPHEWAALVVKAYRDHGCDRVVAEVNNGGELVESTIRTVDPNIPYRALHASRGKHTRAEPIAALYEQGKVSHVGSFPELEDQMCGWDPTTGEKSPDRLDGAVWLLTDLMLDNGVVDAGFSSQNYRGRLPRPRM